jgi:3',5'-cyclic AMP phosphodiesterase CpdA
MSAAVIVGDIHVSDRAPSSRTSDYTKQILAKIKFAAEYAWQMECPLVFAGDVFHLKASSKNSHRLVQAVHDALSAAPHTYIVPGNHDLEGDRLDSLPKQPLGALARMEGVSLLMGELFPQLHQIVSVPYLTEFDGGDWKEALKPWEEQIGGADLLVTHAPIFPPGQAPGVYASIDPAEWASVMDDLGIDNTYYGHIHENHGTYEVNGHTFCNQGALSRGSLHESSVSREPAVTYWDGTSFSRIPVPHLPAAEVFLFDQAEIKAENKESAKAFADALGQTTLTALTLEEVLSTIRLTTPDAAVLRQVEECLELARSER